MTAFANIGKSQPPIPWVGSGEMFGAVNVPKSDGNFFPPDSTSCASPVAPSAMWHEAHPAAQNTGSPRVTSPVRPANVSAGKVEGRVSSQKVPPPSNARMNNKRNMRRIVYLSGTVRRDFRHDTRTVKFRAATGYFGKRSLPASGVSQSGQPQIRSNP